jgi:hypothetical protein
MTTWTILLLKGAAFCGPAKRRDPTAGLPARPGEEWFEIVCVRASLSALGPAPGRRPGWENLNENSGTFRYVFVSLG